MTPTPQPGHVEGGLYRLLRSARLYEALQFAFGAHAVRSHLVRDYVCAPPAPLVLDIGCGTGTILTYLPPDTRYVGYDSNARYIEDGRRRFGHRAELIEGRAEELPRHALAGTFDRVLAFSILHHLDESAARRLVASAFEHLRPGGRLITFDPAVHDRQRFLARWLARADRGKRVRTPEGYRALVATAFDMVEVHLRDDLGRVPYSHAVVVATR